MCIRDRQGGRGAVTGSGPRAQPPRQDRASCGLPDVSGRQRHDASASKQGVRGPAASRSSARAPQRVDLRPKRQRGDKRRLVLCALRKHLYLRSTAKHACPTGSTRRCAGSSPQSGSGPQPPGPTTPSTSAESDAGRSATPAPPSGRPPAERGRLAAARSLVCPTGRPAFRRLRAGQRSGRRHRARGATCPPPRAAASFAEALLGAG
eukprot:13769623-Alexandrium_andersonii.AAC.1